MNESESLYKVSKASTTLCIMLNRPSCPFLSQSQERKVPFIAARDHFLDRYPELVFVGAHIGSLRWNLEEVAKRFDDYPNFYVDLSARMLQREIESLHFPRVIVDKLFFKNG